MELSGYIAVVRRWWWTLLVAAWVAGLTGFLVASQIPPTYESRVSLLVGPINTDQNTLRASGQLVQTYAQLVTTAPLLDSAIQETGLAITSAELVPAIRATANDVTRILSIRIQSGSAQDAATIANAIATELIQLASRGIGRPEGQVQIIEPAAVIDIPVAPQVSILVLLAAGAGLIGALVIVLLIEYLSDSVRSREDLVRTSGATPLGVVGTGGSELLAMPSGRAGQSYLLLAAKLILAREARDTASILVLDATTTRTASVVAANLAAAVGRLGRKAVVIDGAPGQQGGLTPLFGLAGRAGVSDFLVGTTSRDLASMADGINIVPSGTIDLPAIDVDRCRELVAAVSKSYDVVLVATAPVTESAIATVWARACDGAMLIAERDHSRRSDVALATESLALVERPLIGVVLAERGRSLRGRARSTPAEPIRPAAVRVRAPERSWDVDPGPRPSVGSYAPERDPATIANLRPTPARPPDTVHAATPPSPGAPFRLSAAAPAAPVAFPSSTPAPTPFGPGPVSPGPVGAGPVGPGPVIPMPLRPERVPGAVDPPPSSSTPSRSTPYPNEPVSPPRVPAAAPLATPPTRPTIAPARLRRAIPGEAATEPANPKTSSSRSGATSRAKSGSAKASAAKGPSASKAAGSTKSSTSKAGSKKTTPGSPRRRARSAPSSSTDGLSD